MENSSRPDTGTINPMCATSLAKHHIPQVRQLLYSPDIVQSEFFLPLQIKNALRGNSFEYMVTIKHNGTQQHLDPQNRV
jgi:hypothetical protein